MRGYDYAGPIQTERLVLRAFEPGDFDAVYAMRSNPDVVRYLYWDVHTEDQARRALGDRIGFRSIHHEGDVLALAAVPRGANDMVVDVILRCVSEAHSLAEIGYIVHPDHQGNGYATEAARAVLAIAFDEAGFHRVIGSLEARNAASARVLEKLGMRREAHLVENEWVKGEWQSEVLYAMLDREWRSLR
ncbi:MAG TPA: GNAT family protein [Actinomycetota bacterium]|nr:GNAT family protein [Actinomycetota bacterium]